MLEKSQNWVEVELKGRTLSPAQQKSYLYWRGQIKFDGKLKKRYNPYPNQLYRHITKKKQKQTKLNSKQYSKSQQ